MKYLETFSHLAALAIDYSSLIAKTTQIPEMHHRVKNHLQDVANLLSLEIHRLRTPQAREPLENTLNRLKGMSVAYDLLARGEQYESANGHARVNLKEVLGELSTKVWEAMVPPEKDVEIEVAGDSLWVPSRQATAAGMVVNELVTNALKHGLALQPCGTVQVMLQRQDEGARISVHDNGSGLPPNFDAKTNARLGLTIVQTLVERDLGGELTFHNAAGTTVGFSLRN
jgi:two-component sensor histidine kinase